jgi:hypothetical protein
MLTGRWNAFQIEWFWFLIFEQIFNSIHPWWSQTCILPKYLDEINININITSMINPRTWSSDLDQDLNVIRNAITTIEMMLAIWSIMNRFNNSIDIYVVFEHSDGYKYEISTRSSHCSCHLDILCITGQKHGPSILLLFVRPLLLRKLTIREHIQQINSFSIKSHLLITDIGWRNQNQTL